MIAQSLARFADNLARGLKGINPMTYCFNSTMNLADRPAVKNVESRQGIPWRLLSR
jgi:hypothetical protein